MRSRLRSTAAKKMSFRVARLMGTGKIDGREMSRGGYPQPPIKDSTVLRPLRQCAESHGLCLSGLPDPRREDMLGGTPRGRSSMQMKRSGVLAAALLVTMTAGLVAQTKKEASNMPKVGDMAPDFSLKYFDGSDLKDVKLSDYRGKKNVVLAFYIFAFTGG